MEQKKDVVASIMEDFIDVFDEHVFCLFFSSQGIAKMGEDLAKHKVKEDHRTWIGSNPPKNPKMHASINTHDGIKKCKADGHFTNLVGKSLLCTMYSLWDEEYRHRIAEVVGCEAKDLECPLMGDLRKIRHCVIHQKSIVPEHGFNFEIIKWVLPPGKLNITFDMFLEFNDLVRGRGMAIRRAELSPEMKEIMAEMTDEERKSFDDFYKNRRNRSNNAEWPGFKAFLDRTGRLKKSI